MRILFWGTADFAIPSLRAVTEADHEVVAVVTQPDRPAGRGRKPRPPPVKEEAAALGLPVVQPEKPRGEAFLDRLRALDPEVTAVAAYGEILTREVLDLPPAGSLNVHASLLPRLRGAAPVNWAVIRGHEESGVTIMRMVRELDAGPILVQRAVRLTPRVTAGELFERLAPLGGELLVEALSALEAGELEERKQDDARATYAPKLDRGTARLDWSLPARAVDRWIRGLDPWPGAWSELDGRSVKFFRPAAVEDAAGGESRGASGEGPGDGTAGEGPGDGAAADAAPGTVLRADPTEGVTVAAGEGALRLGDVQPAGSRRMSAAAWARGRGVAAGDRFR